MLLLAWGGVFGLFFTEFDAPYNSALNNVSANCVCLQNVHTNVAVQSCKNYSQNRDYLVRIYVFTWREVHIVGVPSRTSSLVCCCHELCICTPGIAWLKTIDYSVPLSACEHFLHAGPHGETKPVYGTYVKALLLRSCRDAFRDMQR